MPNNPRELRAALTRVYLRKDTAEVISEELIPLVRKRESRLSLERYDAIHAAIEYYLETFGVA